MAYRRCRVGACRAARFGAMFAPIYVDNLKLQTYVEEITRSCGQPESTG